MHVFLYLCKVNNTSKYRTPRCYIIEKKIRFIYLEKKKIENYKKNYLYYICLNKNNSLTQIHFLYTSQKF